MKVCEQALKPRARPFSESWLPDRGLPLEGFRWYVYDGIFGGWGETLDAALHNQRVNRLSHQISGWRNG